jgi:hypothetical protein
MARFAKTTLVEVGGTSADIIAEELLHGSDIYWEVTIRDNIGAVDLSAWTFNFRLVRRSASAITDTRNSGLEIKDMGTYSGAREINLDNQVRVYDARRGRVRLLINQQFFSQVTMNPNDTVAPVYTGYFSATLPAQGLPENPEYIPAQTKKIPILLIVRGDGIVTSTVAA